MMMMMMMMTCNNQAVEAKADVMQVRDVIYCSETLALSIGCSAVAHFQFIILRL